MTIRNLELGRRILRSAERGTRLDARDPSISYHVIALRGSGLINASLVRAETDIHDGMVATRLTDKGREFLELADDDWLWRRTSAHFTRPGVFFSVANIFDYLKQNALHRSGAIAA